MKNKIIFAIAAIMLTALTACGKNNDAAQSSAPVVNTEAVASAENGVNR